jgi:poly(3-hydroxyalkanoate) synthetase
MSRNVTGARRDQLLLKYMENATDITDQEILFLAQHISNTTNNPTEPHKDNLTLDQAKQKINDWIDDEQQGGRPKWFEIRMVVENAMKYSCGIWNIGPAAVLTEMREQFDEDGVMRY